MPTQIIVTDTNPGINDLSELIYSLAIKHQWDKINHILKHLNPATELINLSFSKVTGITLGTYLIAGARHYPVFTDIFRLFPHSIDLLEVNKGPGDGKEYSIISFLLYERQFELVTTLCELANYELDVSKEIRIEKRFLNFFAPKHSSNDHGTYTVTHAILLLYFEQDQTLKFILEKNTNFKINLNERILNNIPTGLFSGR